MLIKQQKWIALFVALTFIWLMQFSAMPVTAAGASAQAGIGNSEQGPDYYEAVSRKVGTAKKSMLPWILIGVGVVGVTAAVLFLVLKTNYDIRGTWIVHITYDDDDYVWDTLPVFAGSKKSGTSTDNNSGTGTYTVDGKNVTFSLRWPNSNTSTFTGQFNTKDTMSGRFHETANWDGNWTAVRAASGASLPKVKVSAKKKGPTN